MNIQTIKDKIIIYKSYANDLIKLSIPIIMGNVGNMLIGVGDVIVAGRHSTITLAAISIASAIFMTFMIAGVGFMASISPVVSNLRGQRCPSKNLFGVTLQYAVIIGLVFFVLVRAAIPLVDSIGLADNLSGYVIEYLRISSWGIFAVMIFVAIKEFLQAYEIVMFPNMISVVQIFLNLFLNIVLVFGFLGFPEMGVKGLAIASLVVRCSGAIAIFIYSIPFLQKSAKKCGFYIKDLVKTGWPISLALFFEFLGFNITAVLVGKFSALYAACHNIIITLTSTTYMFPLSVSNAIAIKVGFANGEKNLLNIKRFALAGTYVIVGFMAINMILYGVFPKQLLHIFTNDPNVVKTCLPVFGIVLCFLFFDGIQCACVGALKGLKETRPIMWTMAIAYAVISIPIGSILAFKFGIILTGFWSGLAFGILAACIVSSVILIRKVKKLSKIY